MSFKSFSVVPILHNSAKYTEYAASKKKLQDKQEDLIFVNQLGSLGRSKNSF